MKLNVTVPAEFSRVNQALDRWAARLRMGPPVSQAEHV
jgi:hypothetical protein